MCGSRHVRWRRRRRWWWWWWHLWHLCSRNVTTHVGIIFQQLLLNRPRRSIGGGIGCCWDLHAVLQWLTIKVCLDSGTGDGRSTSSVNWTQFLCFDLAVQQHRSTDYLVDRLPYQSPAECTRIRKTVKPSIKVQNLEESTVIQIFIYSEKVCARTRKIRVQSLEPLWLSFITVNSKQWVIYTPFQNLRDGMDR